MELNEESIKRREQIKFTDHARLEMEKDGISADDVLNAIENGKVIEEYVNESRKVPNLWWGYKRGHCRGAGNY